MRPYRRQLLRLLSDRPCPITLGAEIGVARGETSATLLRYFPQLTLILVDAWSTYCRKHSYRQSGDAAARQSEIEQTEAYHAALAVTDFAQSRRQIVRDASLSAANRVENVSLDFAFIDGDHTYEGVSGDLLAWFPKLKPHGLLCGHDYGHPRDRRGRWGVTRSVHEFAELHGYEVHEGDGTIWWIDLSIV